MNDLYIATPYDVVYEPVTSGWLASTGYDWEEDDDIYFSQLFEENGLEFAGYAVAMEPYYDMCADSGEDLVCVDTDGQCYIVVNDSITYATDWASRYDDEQFYDDEFDDYDD